MEHKILIHDQVHALRKAQKSGTEEYVVFKNLSSTQKEMMALSSYNYVATKMDGKDSFIAFTWLDSAHWDRLRRDVLK